MRIFLYAPVSVLALSGCTTLGQSGTSASSAPITQTESGKKSANIVAMLALKSTAEVEKLVGKPMKSADGKWEYYKLPSAKLDVIFNSSGEGGNEPGKKGQAIRLCFFDFKEQPKNWKDALLKVGLKPEGVAPFAGEDGSVGISGEFLKGLKGIPKEFMALYASSDADRGGKPSLIFMHWGFNRPEYAKTYFSGQ